MKTQKKGVLSLARLMGCIGVFVIVRDDCWLLKPVSRTPVRQTSLSFSHTHTVDPMTHLDAKQKFKLSQTSKYNFQLSGNMKSCSETAAPVIDKKNNLNLLNTILFIHSVFLLGYF